VGKDICKVGVLAWLVLLLLVFSCEKDVKKLLRIRVEPGAIYVAGNEITKTVAIAKQDTLMIEALDSLLRNKREKALVFVQIEPSVTYGVLFKIVTTIGALGYTDVNITSRINDKNDTESVYLPKISDPFGGNNCLKLTVGIYKDYFEIWAGGSSLPKIHIVNPIRFTYEELAMNLADVRSRFINCPDIDEIIIFGEDDTKILNIIQAMHVADTIGFNKKNLSRLVTPIQLTEEDSIRRYEEFKATQRKMDSLFSLGLDTSSLAKLFVENKMVPFGDTNVALNYAKYLIRTRIEQEKRDSIFKELRERRKMPIVDVKPMDGKRTSNSTKQTLKKCGKEVPFLPCKAN